jgi:hypothetical protein
MEIGAFEKDLFKRKGNKADAKNAKLKQCHSPLCDLHVKT